MVVNTYGVKNIESFDCFRDLNRKATRDQSRVLHSGQKISFPTYGLHHNFGELIWVEAVYGV